MQIILGIIFLIIVVAFLLSKTDIMTPRTKTILFTVVMTIVSAAILYEFMFSKKEQNNRVLINAFKQGKTLQCKEVDVNQSNYLLETGTLSFMAKNTNKEIIGTIYAIEDCILKE
ncbi:MAG: hypothetical protein K0U47_05425 [Epsilonproteobacteria bacterium]|nr:hypothetical protein [Campylobacterota bacterium]